ncbi:MAG: hypothetical protein JXJ04_04670 [Spirochaetales bacterium]|nr:hypothetical protein [Spirochaetales bacterium]
MNTLSDLIQTLRTIHSRRRTLFPAAYSETGGVNLAKIENTISYSTMEDATNLPGSQALTLKLILSTLCHYDR